MTSRAFSQVLKKLRASAKAVKKAIKHSEHTPKEDSFFWRIKHIATVSELHPLFWKRGPKNRGGAITCKHSACGGDCRQMLWRKDFKNPDDWKTIDKPGIGYIYISRQHWLKAWVFHVLYHCWESVTFPIENWLEHQIKDFWKDHELSDNDKPASKEYNRYQWLSRMRWVYSPANLVGNWHRWEIRAIHPAKITKAKSRKH